jgi:DNA mismatch endonuclease (patch repair protein)
MPDIFTKAKRSDVMSRIRSRDNQDTELLLARYFRRARLTGWRRQLTLRPSPRLKVKPDFVFRARRVAVFVDGCFWHGCPRHGTRPRGNAAFWRRKFAANRARDARVTRALRRAGWHVLRLWEHELPRLTRRPPTAPLPARLRLLQGRA